MARASPCATHDHRISGRSIGVERLPPQRSRAPGISRGRDESQFARCPYGREVSARTLSPPQPRQHVEQTVSSCDTGGTARRIRVDNRKEVGHSRAAARLSRPKSYNGR